MLVRKYKEVEYVLAIVERAQSSILNITIPVTLAPPDTPPLGNRY